MKNKKEIKEIIGEIGKKYDVTKTFRLFSLIVLVILVVYVVGVSLIMNGNNTSVPGQTSNIFYWTGAGNDSNWSSVSNWNQNRVPDKNAVVIFDASANQEKESVVDEAFSGEISSLRIDGYKEKIIQNIDLTIKGDYYQSSGSYEVLGILRVKGNFTQRGEAMFDLGSSGMEVEGVFEKSDSNFKINEGGAASVVYLGQKKVYRKEELDGEGYDARNIDLFGKTMSDGVWFFDNNFNVFTANISQENGWEIIPYNEGEKWQYLFSGVKRGDSMVYESQNNGIRAERDTVYINRGNGIQEYYLNSYKGIEQVFVLQNKPVGNGSLVLSGSVLTKDLFAKKNSSDSISFLTKDGYVGFNLDHLKIYDANGKEFKAVFNLSEKKGDIYLLDIEINDTGAVYPLTIDPLSSTADWQAYISDTDDQWFGKNVSGAGDINGDGVDDIMVGSYQSGRKVYFYYGSNLNGVSGGSSVVSGSSAPIAGSDKSISSGITREICDIASAGNINGDKSVAGHDFDDIIIGQTDHDGATSGSVSAYYGSSSGPSEVVGTYWNVSGDTNDSFGWSVAGVGDIDGNGYDDVMVGAPDYNTLGLPHRGRVRLYLGGSSGLPSSPSWSLTGANGDYLGSDMVGLGDLDGNGKDEFAVSAPQAGGKGEVYIYYMNGSGVLVNSATISSPGKDNFGVSITSGDFNGDNKTDLAVGASNATRPFGSDGSGAVYVYYGNGAGGFSSTPSWSYVGSSIRGFGYSVAGLNINGDGCSDLIVGSWLWDGDGAKGTASAFYCSGAPGSLPSSPDWSKSGSLDNQLEPGDNTHFAFDVADAGDVDGDGDSEVLIGSYHYDGSKAFMFEGFGACSPLNNKPTASISGFTPNDLCQGLNYTLNWNFNDIDADLQSAYDIEVREKNITSPVLTDHKNLSEKFYKILNGAVGAGSIVYGKNYEWRVKVYDDDTRPLCGGISDWSDWSDLATQGFTTPKNRYPEADFSAMSGSKDCLVVGTCDFLETIALNDKSKSYSSNPITAYSWYIDNMTTVFSSTQNTSRIFLEAEGKDHEVRLSVTDENGYSCFEDKDIKLGVSNPSWTEVTPR